jgi:hypothetical protein
MRKIFVTAPQMTEITAMSDQGSIGDLAEWVAAAAGSFDFFPWVVC